MRAILKQVVEFNAMVDEIDAKAIMLNNIPSKYNNVIFTLSWFPSQTLENIIVSL